MAHGAVLLVCTPFFIRKQLKSAATATATAVLFPCKKGDIETGRALFALRARTPATKHWRPSTLATTTLRAMVNAACCVQQSRLQKRNSYVCEWVSRTSTVFLASDKFGGSSKSTIKQKQIG